MTSFMIIVEIALFLVLLGFTWYRLDAFESIEKIGICAGGILLSWAITSILFSISTNGINYINLEIKAQISKILVLIFTPINGIVLMPFSAKILSDIRFQQIDTTETSKRIIVLIAIMILVSIVEVKYLTNIQLEILKIVNSL